MGGGRGVMYKSDESDVQNLLFWLALILVLNIENILISTAYSKHINEYKRPKCCLAKTQNAASLISRDTAGRKK